MVQGLQGVRVVLCTLPIGHPPGVGWWGEGLLSATSFWPPVHGDLGVWCGVVWCGVVWCGVVWCGVVWCGVVWCGVVWCGVVWCGVVWCGVVWCAEGAVTQRQWSGWSCTRESASREGCVSKRALCVVCCAPRRAGNMAPSDGSLSLKPSGALPAAPLVNAVGVLATPTPSCLWAPHGP